ncbi:MAG: hypothetical protein NC209_03865 [Alistipes sp.]|nr:hypothetical protein [Alistipes sp.]
MIGQEEQKVSMDETAMFDLAVKANAVQRGIPEKMAIGGKIWRQRRISQRQAVKISNLDFDAIYYQREMQKEGISRRMAKRLNTKFRQIAAKKAAHYVLGQWLWLVPFFYALTWRWIYNQSEEVSATINSAQMVGGRDKDFYLANLGCSKYQLVLSTKQVGESVKQMQERKESAENMLDEDASPKKAEGSKSAAHSKPRPTTRK